MYLKCNVFGESVSAMYKTRLDHNHIECIGLYFSLHLTLLEGFNHFINFFEWNHLRSACCNRLLMSPVLYMSPRS